MTERGNQVDEAGRVNVHPMKARPHLSVGIGGFLDIAASARRLVFVGYFTAGGLQLELQGERLRILREGKTSKFVRSLDAVSFDPKHSRVEEILFVTGRATLALRDGSLEIVEVVPGVDLERDVIGQMQFRPRVTDPWNLICSRIVAAGASF